jgi:Phage integrase, N-terminal SAM-like domain
MYIAPNRLPTRVFAEQLWRIRYLHYSLSTEKVYLYWVKFFVRWHGRSGLMRHPREMGVREVEAFLTMLTFSTPARHRDDMLLAPLDGMQL